MDGQAHEQCWKVIDDTMHERDRMRAELKQANEEIGRLGRLLEEERKTNSYLRTAIQRAMDSLGAWAH